MQSFRNLRLAVRLAIAFGALAAGLLLVASSPSTRWAVSRRHEELADDDLRASTSPGTSRSALHDRGGSSPSTCS